MSANRMALGGELLLKAEGTAYIVQANRDP
jgi:hypothetical protein